MIDGVLKSEFLHDAHDDTLHHRLSQPSEDLIFENNAELRKNPGIIRDLGKNDEGGIWGRQVASVPMITFYMAIRQGFALNAPDSDIAGREMHRFLQTEEGKKCLVRG
jgi:hypothetical protein